ncbi:PAS domain-containing protein [Octadecabacter sp. G9-8]|uniref:protein-glutamate O-methyltransferase n=1 Tax=Octadecabacter dasysiphoniae TaxID=2909341 RepID=A0ABS9D1C1_9RHOB|nr:chemotaxis protein CheB [Octadecabacter dasysiphoniae]MCF2872088.1 PAS domain-containing protein [Octadecabacter dasysiphoniae]
MKDDKVEDLTIIAIGSSAGGLEAIRELVATLPVNLPVSYVVVQHMSPHHKSLLKELVGRQTSLIVKDVEDGVRPEANVIYITPPKADIILEDGLLRLKPPSEMPAAPKPSVDRFLLSLADDHGAKTMAMILSGTGTDGAYGVQAIREAGGITIAQDAESAKYDGMPQSAIQTGCVDLVLRPVEIGTHLNKILTSKRDFSAFRNQALEETPVSDLLQILLARTRVDFREYKQTTITRRIERRMTALGIESQDEYTQFLRNNPQAVDALFKDLLISVTRFFRDKDEFESLKQMLPKMLAERPDGPLRVWIAGCATGEEAYSIAMLIAEAIGGPDQPLRDKVQIFATDIDKEALQIARAGIYGNAALADIPKNLSSKYLVPHGDGIRVIDELRAAVLFSDHNVCQDPPFQRVHLLCCRNLLIYFGSSLQKKVMARFHYAMASNALLFLGTAESIAGSDELFLQDESKFHVYRKRALSKSGRGAFSMPAVPRYTARDANRNENENSDTPDSQMFAALVKSLGPTSMLVTEGGNILQVQGDISPFIQVDQSSKLKMHLDLLKSPLREEARSLMAISLRTERYRSGIQHSKLGSSGNNIQLRVFPIIALGMNERIAVVAFDETEEPRDNITDMEGLESAGESVVQRIKELENEVAVTREALQQTIEQLETSNEELQSVNEELQSTNEELQATNEEMETSNEELQSTNEELITVNEELQITATELSGRTGELTSVLQSTPLAILVTDSALQITQATTSAAELFGIKQPVATPHISQIVLPDGYPALAPICSETLRLGATTEQEFSSDGTRVVLSCTPYFDVHGKILGLTMVATQFPGLAREMELLLSASNIHVINRKIDGQIIRISESSAKTLGLTRQEAEGANLFDFLPEKIANDVRVYDELVLEGEREGVVETFEMMGKGSESPVYLALERHRFFDPLTMDPTIYMIASDVTDVINATDQTRALIDRFRHLQEIADFGYWELDPVERELYWSPRVFDLHGVPESEGEPNYDDAVRFYHPDDVEMVEASVNAASKVGGEFNFKARLIRKDGTEIMIRSHGIAITNSQGRLTKVVGAFAKA